MSSFLGRFNRPKKTQSTQSKSLISSPGTPLNRTATSSSSKLSLRQRLSRPTPNHAETAPSRLVKDREGPPPSDNVTSNLSVTGTTSTKTSTRPNTALNVLKLTLSTLSSASDGLPAPGLKVAVDILFSVLDNLERSDDNDRGFSTLTERMVRVNNLLLSLHKVEANMAAAMPFFEILTKEFNSLVMSIEQFSSQGTIAQFFNSSDNASSLSKHTATLDSIINDFTLAISIDHLAMSANQFALSIGTDKRVADVQNEMKSLAAEAIIKGQLARFNTLNRVAEAAYNSSAREFATGCLAGTRVGVLNAIHDWVNDPSSTMLFWLNGAAGTGKSAVAHSIALAYDNQQRRMASFFFSRDQQSRRETRFLFQTIAFQLGNGHPALKVEIAKALEDQTILTSNLQRQLQKLIFEPLSKITSSYPPIVVVVDALDESDNEDAVSLIIRLLVANSKDNKIPLKFIITSRPETHIRSTFQSPEVDSGTYPLVLHDMKASDIRQDIHAFVRHELTEIATSCQAMLKSDQWPKEDEIEALVDISAELFIAAATALKFIRPIRGSRDPRVRMAMLLNSTKKGSTSESRAFQYLDHMYAEILKNATGGEPSDVLQTIIGAIVLAFGRLTVDEWNVLLQMEDDIAAALADLQSVILVPEGDAIRTFHKSFRDFLTDNGRCTDGKFFVDSPLRHAEMTRSCLQRMIGSLRRDICDIQDRTKMNSDVHDLDHRITDRLPGELQYACRYWALHLSECSPVESLLDLLRSFVFTSILYWIEVLSILGDLGGGLKSLRQVQAKLSSVPNLPKGLLELLSDTERFLFDFYDGISVSALHVYYSALPFCPKGTLLYQTFLSELTDAPKLVSGVGDKWNACLRTMEGHTDSVLSVAISHDGGRVVSSSSDKTIRIWDAQTGAVSQIFEGHSGSIRSVAMTRDGCRVASASDDETIRIWDAQSGATMHIIKQHPYPVRSVAISYDGTRVFSGAHDNAIRIWDIETGVPLQVLNGHSGAIVAIAISRDGTRLVSASDDHTARIWDSQVGVALHELKGHSFWVTTIALSEDGTLAVSGSYDKTIRIWDAVTGGLLRTIAARSGPVRSVAISNDGKRVVSGFDDQTIRFWDIQTGAALYHLSGHANSVWSVTMSPDDLHIVSGSYDGVICIWDAQIYPALHETGGYSGSVLSIAISHDGNRVVSGSYDDTVRIWDAHSGKSLRKLEGHSSSVRSVIFSEDDTLTVSGSDDETVRIWDALTGAAVHELRGHSNWVRSVVISPDRSRVISGSYDATIRIWDTKSGALLHELIGHSSSVLSLAMSHDGTCVISSSSDGTVRTWNAGTGSALRELKGHSDPVRSVAVSHDSSRIISGSYDRTIRIWETETGATLHTLNIPDSIVPNISFSSDETSIVSHGSSFPIPPHARPLSQPPVINHRPAYGFQGGWIVEGGKRRCWIPVGYRGIYAASAPLVVFGTPKGNIVFLRFPQHT